MNGALEQRSTSAAQPPQPVDARVALATCATVVSAARARSRRVDRAGASPRCTSRPSAASGSSSAGTAPRRGSSSDSVGTAAPLRSSVVTAPRVRRRRPRGPRPRGGRRRARACGRRRGGVSVQRRPRRRRRPASAGRRRRRRARDLQRRRGHRAVERRRVAGDRGARDARLLGERRPQPVDRAAVLGALADGEHARGALVRIASSTTIPRATRARAARASVVSGRTPAATTTRSAPQRRAVVERDACGRRVDRGRPRRPSAAGSAAMPRAPSARMHRGGARVELLGHQVVGGLDDRDRHAACAQAGRGLQAEQPAADHDRARAPRQRRARRATSRAGAEAWTCGRSAPAIGGTNGREPVASDERVVGGGSSPLTSTTVARRGVDRRGRAAAAQVDRRARRTRPRAAARGRPGPHVPREQLARAGCGCRRARAPRRAWSPASRRPAAAHDLLDHRQPGHARCRPPQRRLSGPDPLAQASRAVAPVVTRSRRTASGLELGLLGGRVDGAVGGGVERWPRRPGRAGRPSGTARRRRRAGRPSDRVRR